MTVRQLAATLTIEELIAWSAFYDIKNEEEEKVMERAQASRGAQPVHKR